MSNNSKRKEESHQLNGGVKQSTWSKAFNSNAVWEEKVSPSPLQHIPHLDTSRSKLRGARLLPGVRKDG